MVTETVETTQTPLIEVADPEPQAETQTEEPEATEIVAPEPAAAEPEAAAAPQIEVVEEKPDYITRDVWEREKAEIAQRAAADALELDRRRRQTENARRAAAEKRESEERAETMDVVRGTLASKLGIDPTLISDDVVDTAITRAARKRAEGMLADHNAVLEGALDYITAPAFNKEGEWDEAYTPLVNVIAPKLQGVVNQIRPAIAAQAIEDFKANGGLKKAVDDEIARRAAQSRQAGPDELKRAEGTPASADTGSLSYWETRLAHENEDGYPEMTPTDWGTYLALRRREGLS